MQIWRERATKPIKTLKRKISLQNTLHKLDHLKTSYAVNRSDRKRTVIVSLTSYPSRFSSVEYAIKSMLVQTVRPDRIILFLDDTCSDVQLPQRLTDLIPFGLEIEYRPVDMKPHKKYYYAIKENPDAYVITVDDDIIYPANLIEELLKTSDRFPGCVAATRAHQVLFGEDGKVLPYNQWRWEATEVNKPMLSLLATGAGGVLYPPHCMTEALFDLDLLMKLSPRQDDLWLKFIQIQSGTSVVLCDQKVRKARLPMPENAIGSLNSSNVHQNMNDVYMANLMDYFGFGKKDFGYEEMRSASI